MLFGGRYAVYCENRTEHINMLWGQNAEFSMLKRVVHIETTGFKGLIRWTLFAATAYEEKVPEAILKQCVVERQIENNGKDTKYESKKKLSSNSKSNCDL
jgi:hypothetical protein